MLDVLHYYFEEDFHQDSAEASARKSALRDTVYETLYEDTYKYSVDTKTASTYKNFDPEDYETEDAEEMIVPEPFKPSKPKAYTPPTEMTSNKAAPFGSILDAPLR